MTRKPLGLPNPWHTKHPGVSCKPVQHWQTGRYATPDGARPARQDPVHRTGDCIGTAVEEPLDIGNPAMATDRAGEEYAAARRASTMPATWHRMVIVQSALEDPVLSVVHGAAVRSTAEEVGR